MSKKRIFRKELYDKIDEAIARVDYIIEFNAWFRRKGSSKTIICPANIYMYEGFLSCCNNIWETIKCHHGDDAQKERYRSLIRRYIKQIKKHKNEMIKFHFISEMLKTMISFVEFNPFFVWSFQFTWIKHNITNRAYHSQLRKYNYELLFFHNIAAKFLSKNKNAEKSQKYSINFFNHIKQVSEINHKKLNECCKSAIYNYGDNLDNYFGIYFLTKFSNYESLDDMDTLCRIKQFLELLYEKDFTWIKKHKYTLWLDLIVNYKHPEFNDR